MKFSADEALRFAGFIRERELLRFRKEHGLEPWTTDPILSKYRFCNVHREDDKVTRWISENWRAPYKNLRHLWFFMVLARMINNIESLEELPPPSDRWLVGTFLKKMKDREQKGLRVFNPAYIVSTCGKQMNKIDYVAEHILLPAWMNRHNVHPSLVSSLQDYAELLQKEVYGVSTFMAGQIIADLKYEVPLLDMFDWETFAVSGPGSRRGLNRLCERPIGSSWKESEWHAVLLQLRGFVVDKALPTVQLAAKMPKEAWIHDLHAQDLQNCLCEYDKYCRVANNEGKAPKQLYRREK